MPVLPTGTVTFLFTDIEDSARLRQQQTEAMKIARERHNLILRQTIEAHVGYVFQIIGDAFCAAFATATDALVAACAAQRALHLEFGGETPLPSNLPLPTSNLPLRVRMGLHTGAAETRAGAYQSNLTLIRAQRIMAAGHGGQILLSRATEELVHDHLPQGVSLRDLGTHRLKGLDRPERIFQVVVAELPANFSPLRVLESSTVKHETTAPPMLPFERSVISPVLIGRAASLQTLEQLIAQVRHSKGQTVLITGEAGIGKSRLVAEAKARFSTSPPTPLLQGEGSRGEESRILQGRCFEHDRALPYAPLLDLLRLYFAGRAPADVLNDLGPTAPELVKLLPELCTRLPDLALSPLLEPEQEKRRLFEALTQFLTRLATSGRGEMYGRGNPAPTPLLLIIEDIHWSDDTSLEYLLSLAHRLASQPMLLLMTYRRKV